MGNTGQSVAGGSIRATIGCSVRVPPSSQAAVNSTVSEDMPLDAGVDSPVTAGCASGPNVRPSQAWSRVAVSAGSRVVVVMRSASRVTVPSPSGGPGTAPPSAVKPALLAPVGRCARPSPGQAPLMGRTLAWPGWCLLVPSAAVHRTVTASGGTILRCSVARATGAPSAGDQATEDR